MKIDILLKTVCAINYDSNCGNCCLRTSGRCEALTKDNKYNEDLKGIANDFLKDKTIFVYQSK